MRLISIIAMCAFLPGPDALAQEPAAAPATSPPVLPETGETAWSFSLSAATYVVPDGRDYVQPTVTADRDWLHLEARYNYEALDTASVWVGYNFKGGEAIAWEFTPMVGGVFGDASGVAVGYKGALRWWKLELYSEGEYLYDSGHPSDSFLYNWTELTLAPVDWLRFGLVAQRTRAYESDRDIQRGVLVGFSWKDVDVTGYVLNPDDDGQRTFIITVGLSF